MVKKSSTIFNKNNNADAQIFTRGINEIPKRDLQQNKAARDLDKLVLGSERVILDIKAVFPFNFFPDEVIADEAKVSVHTNYFFYTKEVRSIEYKEIFNVAIRQGIFFASLEIVDRFFSQDPLIVPYLWKKDAIRARRIIQGMMIARAEGIDTHTLPIADLVHKLDRIGKTR